MGQCVCDHGKTYDEIRIRELKLFAWHGVYDQEKREGQHFYLNVTLFLDLSAAGRKDDLGLSVNYGEVCERLSQWMTETKHDLIEAVAENLSEKLLLEFPLIHHLDLEIRKPEAPIELSFGSVSVKISRGWHQVYLGIGSNLGDREGYLSGALEGLRSQKSIRNVRSSSFLETKPYGYTDQEDFLNGVVALETFLSPHALLDLLHELEGKAGRTREIHWGPRTLDLDILFYDKLVYEDEQLILPHVDLENREFVLRPLCELAPNLRHPIFQKTMRQLLLGLAGE